MPLPAPVISTVRTPGGVEGAAEEAAEWTVEEAGRSARAPEGADRSAVMGGCEGSSGFWGPDDARSDAPNKNPATCGGASLDA